MIDWKKISTSIINNLDDQGKITQILSDLETEITTYNTRLSELEKIKQTQEEQIESLQKTNMNLFLKLGNPVPDESVRTDEPKLTYDDLLDSLMDEKGGLKI